MYNIPQHILDYKIKGVFFHPTTVDILLLETILSDFSVTV